MKLSKVILLWLLLLLTPLAFGDTAQPIQQLLQTAPQNNLAQRIHYFSAALLNRPYVNEPLGEGLNGEFNQEPLYRLERFDCQTFVETVMALSLAHNLAEFKALLTKIRYANGEITFAKRNHFPSADWLPNNSKNGFIQDITEQVAGQQNIATASAYINRQQWYRYLTQNRIKIPGLTPAEVYNKLKQLQAQGQFAVNTWASIRYIPLNKLLIKGKPDQALLNQIPDGAIVLIVKHLPLANMIGTDMNVSHMGFAIWQHHTLYFRAASAEMMRTTDIKLTDYLRKEKGIKGISLYQIKSLRSFHTTIFAP